MSESEITILIIAFYNEESEVRWVKWLAQSQRVSDKTGI